MILMSIMSVMLFQYCLYKVNVFFYLLIGIFSKGKSIFFNICINIKLILIQLFRPLFI